MREQKLLCLCPALATLSPGLKTIHLRNTLSTPERDSGMSMLPPLPHPHCPLCCSLPNAQSFWRVGGSLRARWRARRRRPSSSRFQYTRGRSSRRRAPPPPPIARLLQSLTTRRATHHVRSRLTLPLEPGVESACAAIASLRLCTARCSTRAVRVGADLRGALLVGTNFQGAQVDKAVQDLIDQAAEV